MRKSVRGVRWRRSATLLLAAAMGASLLGLSPNTASADGHVGLPADAAPTETPYYSFVSTPDFTNIDLGNLRGYWRYDTFLTQWKRRFPGVTPPNSWSAGWQQWINAYLGAVKAERGNDVLTAGDLVNGRWTKDSFKLPNGKIVRSRMFGDVSGTREERLVAVKRAADFYFSRHARWFRNRGLNLYPAVGDHEYLDNPWNAPHLYPKRQAFPLIRDRFHYWFLKERFTQAPAKSFATKTAYATYLHAEVMLVSLDAFWLRDGRVYGDIGPGQLRWLDAVLTEANARGTDWIIVQAHQPIIPDVRVTTSSGLCYQGGTESALWQTLVRHNVDLYLNGEVHDMSRNTMDGVTQISHGAGGWGRQNWLAADVYPATNTSPGRMEITLKQYPAAKTAPGSIWNTDGQRITSSPTLDPGGPVVQGHLTATDDNQVVSSDGYLDEYTGDSRCGDRY